MRPEYVLVLAERGEVEIGVGSTERAECELQCPAAGDGPRWREAAHDVSDYLESRGKYGHDDASCEPESCGSLTQSSATGVRAHQE